MDLGVDQTAFTTTREHLQLVAVHIVARARKQATGRFSLRVTTGGFGTPEFGDGLRRVRVSGSLLVVESDPRGGASSAAHRIDGASLSTLASLAGVDLTATLDIGHDTPASGDTLAPLTVDQRCAEVIAQWFEVVNRALDQLVCSVPGSSLPTSPRLWPEHFDVALDVAARDGVRANLGGSAGDGYCPEPYLYVGPWTDDRPGPDGYWNAPFGAVLTASDIDDDPVDAALAFFTEGLARLAGGER